MPVPSSRSAELDLESLRREFPLLQQKSYLNSGSYCALATCVQEAAGRYLADRLLVGANWDVWVEKNEAVRAAMASVLGADHDEIAVTTSASAGINSLASALDFRGKRNKVVISDFEFPTNAQIWHAQEPRGARVVHARRARDGFIPAEQFEHLIDEETLLVAITHVCFRNGAKLDVPGVVRLAHSKGAKVLLDCYQSVGALQVNVRALDVDFAVGGMMKYLLGTAGIGFLYARRELIDRLRPANSGWFAQQDIFAMDITANRPSASARRFEAGTPPVINCYMAEAGLNLLLSVGTDVIEQRIRELTQHCLERLDAIGWPNVTPREERRRGPTICVKAKDSAALVARLMEHNVVTSNRDDNVRASFHFYNNRDDVDALVRALAANRDLAA